MKLSRSRGFTLIELLVVIAIIGILSAVVLASLSGTRNKGNDSAVQANLSTIQTQAEIYSNDHSSTYGTAGSSCSQAGSMFVDPTIAKAITSATYSAKGNAIYCGNTASAYAVIATLNGTTTAATQWCVDSTGNAKLEHIASPASATACP
jgi:prepilin-type N-terminal cleavage/methylation domain-containing protein